MALAGKGLPRNEANTEESEKKEGQIPMRFFEVPTPPEVVKVYTGAVWLCELINPLFQLSHIKLNLSLAPGCLIQ